MKQLQFFKIGFWLLLGMNIILASVAILGHINRPQRPVGKPDRGILRTLQFDDQQQKAFRHLADAHREDMIHIQRKSKELVKGYFRTLTSKDEGEKALLLDEIEALEKQKLTITYSHFEDLRDLCREDQLVHFSKALDGAVQQILGNNPGRRPPPGPGGKPGPPRSRPSQ